MKKQVAGPYAAEGLRQVDHGIQIFPALYISTDIKQSNLPLMMDRVDLFFPRYISRNPKFLWQVKYRGLKQSFHCFLPERYDSYCSVEQFQVDNPGFGLMSRMLSQRVNP